MIRRKYHSLMAPLDGTDFAEQILPLAIAVASRSGAVLHLAYVEEPDGDESETRPSDPDYPDSLAATIAAEAGITVETAHLKGRVVEELAGYAEREGIELVAIGTHASTGWSRFLHGSVTDSLIHELRLPFLTIRPVEGDEPGEGTFELEEFDHILIPLDGSVPAESVIGPALALGGADQRVSLVQVIPAPLPNDPAAISYVLTVDQEMVEVSRAEALAYLDGVAARISDLAGRVDTAVILEPRPTTAVLEYADLNDVDLIAIATHGRGGIRRRGLGSVASEILRSATVPVLVLRPSDPYLPNSDQDPPTRSER